MTKKTLSALLAAVLCLLLLSGCSLIPTQPAIPSMPPTPAATPTPTPTPTYTVTFQLNGGTLVSGQATQTVQQGGAAVAPEVTYGNRALSWDADFSNITGDLTVNAQWEKVALDATDLASYVTARTVTVNVVTVTGGQAAGSGFFIDDQGTLVTNYHVIDGAVSISVQVADGANYDVEKVLDFNPTYDMAILKLAITGNDYLEIAQEPVVTGQQVYAVGSSLGTLNGSFTDGLVSSVSRMVGLIDCIQTNTAISHGNSGGPLVNAYGEVQGITSFSYSEGNSLNLAININQLSLLTCDTPKTVTEFREWYDLEVSRSYSPFDGTYFHYSITNTYQTVTGSTCRASVDFESNVIDGYRDQCRFYAYDYVASQYDTYVEYLKTLGFVYNDDETFSDGTSYYYVNEFSGELMDLFVTQDQEQLWIFPQISG